MDEDDAADRVQLAALRAMWWTDTTDPLERAAVLTAVARRLDEMAERDAHAAIDAGETMGKVGRALGISRQAAWRRYAPAAEDAA